MKELLEQNADKVRKLCPDLKVGVYSAGLKKTLPDMWDEQARLLLGEK